MQNCRCTPNAEGMRQSVNCQSDVHGAGFVHCTIMLLLCKGDPLSKRFDDDDDDDDDNGG